MARTRSTSWGTARCRRSTPTRGGCMCMGSSSAILTVRTTMPATVTLGKRAERRLKKVENIEVSSTSRCESYKHVADRLLPDDGTLGAGTGHPLSMVALNADVLSPADAETVAAGPLEV